MRREGVGRGREGGEGRREERRKEKERGEDEERGGRERDCQEDEGVLSCHMKA